MSCESNDEITVLILLFVSASKTLSCCTWSRLN